MGEQLSDGIKTRLETTIDERDNRHPASTNSSTTATVETRRGRGRPRKTNGSTEEENGLSGLASVKDEPLLVSVALPGEDQPKEQPKKKAGRPKGKTSSQPKKVDSTQIQLLLVTLSAVLASRPGMEIWNLSADEAKQIADPLANIMAKNEALGQAMGEHADAFALVTACFIVFIPKLLLYMATKPKKPKQGATLNYGTEPTAKPQQQERENRPPHITDVRGSTSRAKNVNQNFGGQLSAIISPVGGL